MKSTEIFLNEAGLGIREALDEVEAFCKQQKYSKKEMLQTRLLAEELLGMVKGIIVADLPGRDEEKYEAEFWIEGEGKYSELHVTAKTRVCSGKREQFLSVATDGKNMSARGVMGQIRQVVERCLSGYEEVDRFYRDGGTTLYPHMGMSGMMGSAGMIQTWSLQTYISSVQARRGEKQEEWDELEKSIVANLADDVLVGVQNKKVEIIVKKTFEDGDRGNHENYLQGNI